jgi:GT2 family glycosyltransferase
MVVLRRVPLEDRPLDPGIDDDDLVVALDAAVELDAATSAALPAEAGRLAADACYADVEINGREIRRPAWSPTRLIGDPTATSPLAVRAGWLRAHDLSPGDPALALHLVNGNATVAHFPAVLTRHDRRPIAATGDDVDRLLRYLGIPATVEPSGNRFLLRADPDFAPAVSVVIPTAGATVEINASPHVAVERLLESLGDLPDRIELILVVGDEYQGDPSILRGAADRRISVRRRPPGPFNFSEAVNLGILQARHDTVLMLNDDIEADGAGFIDAMALHLTDASIAAVGARLLYPDGTIQHSGIVIDDARPLHSFVGWDPAATTAHGGDIARDVMAVTGACLMARRRDLLAVGGLSTGFPLSFGDVDLCVRLRRSTGRVVVEPAATLLHHETLTRAPLTTGHEWDRWIHRWGEIVDPWYHPGHHRPDDPHRLNLNADHLNPEAPPSRPPSRARTTTLRSRVHRARLAPGPD